MDVGNRIRVTFNPEYHRLRSTPAKIKFFEENTVTLLCKNGLPAFEVICRINVLDLSSVNLTITVDLNLMPSLDRTHSSKCRLHLLYSAVRIEI